MPSADQTGGLGGTQPPPPNAPGAITGAAVQAGVTHNVVIANVVLVFAPSGPVGVFVYAAGTTPGPGNYPIAAMTNQTTDPYGNAIHTGVGSYGGVNLAAVLTNASLLLQAAAGQIAGGYSGGLFSGPAGEIFASSGGTTSSDSLAQLTLKSANANSGTSAQIQTAAEVQLNVGASATIPISSSGITTVAQVVSALVSVGIMH